MCCSSSWPEGDRSMVIAVASTNRPLASLRRNSASLRSVESSSCGHWQSIIPVLDQCYTSSIQAPHQCNISATPVQHQCHTNATPVQHLHQCNTSATPVLHQVLHQLLHLCNISATPVPHQCYTSSTPVLHQYYTSATPVLHQCHTSSTPVLHQCHNSATPVLHKCHTIATPVSHQFYTSSTPVLHQCHTQCYTSSTPVLHYTIATPVPQTPFQLIWEAFSHVAINAPRLFVQIPTTIYNQLWVKVQALWGWMKLVSRHTETNNCLPLTTHTVSH